MVLRFFLGLVLIAYGTTGTAAFERELSYSLEAEGNSDDEDRTFSTLNLKLADDFKKSDFHGDYQLDSSLYREHDKNETNDVYKGFLKSQYDFVDSGFWWNFDGLAEVLPIDTGDNIDEFNSQTVTTLTTGPLVSFSRGHRGSLDMGLQTGIVRYTEANLDSANSGASIIYTYPLSSVAKAGIDLGYRSVKYDDSFNAENDFDVSSAGLFYESRRRSISYSLRGASNTIDSDNNPDDQSTYQAVAKYELNSSSTISLELSKSLQSADAFNRLPGNVNDSIFEPGLLLNDRAEIGYEYTYQNLIAGVLLFSNEYENIVATPGDNEDLKGWTLYASKRFNNELILEGFYEHTTTLNGDLDNDDLQVDLTYTRFHTKHISSSIVLFGEIERDDVKEDYDNLGITYRFTAYILR